MTAKFINASFFHPPIGFSMPRISSLHATLFICSLVWIEIQRRPGAGCLAVGLGSRGQGGLNLVKVSRPWHGPGSLHELPA